MDWKGDGELCGACPHDGDSIALKWGTIENTVVGFFKSSLRDCRRVWEIAAAKPPIPARCTHKRTCGIMRLWRREWLMQEKFMFFDDRIIDQMHKLPQQNLRQPAPPNTFNWIFYPAFQVWKCEDGVFAATEVEGKVYRGKVSSDLVGWMAERCPLVNDHYDVMRADVIDTGDGPPIIMIIQWVGSERPSNAQYNRILLIEAELCEAPGYSRKIDTEAIVRCPESEHRTVRRIEAT